MIYRNIKNGATIDITSTLTDDEWVAVTVSEPVVVKKPSKTVKKGKDE